MILRLLIFLTVVPFVLAGSGDTGFSFLKIGAGARASSMGGAASAITTDATSTYWNPGALAGNPDRQLFVAYNQWIAGTRHHFVAARFGSSWAVSFISTGVDGIEQREIPSENPTATFASHDLAFGITYARPLNDQWSAGVTAKWIHERIQSGVSALAMDVGLLYRPALSNRWTAACTVTNFGFSGKLVNERITLPTTFRLGSAYQLLQRTAFGVLVSADVVQPLHDDTLFDLGGEIGYKDAFFARGGYEFGSSSRGLSAGLGAHWNDWIIDYSITFLDQSLGQAHRWSVGFNF